MIETNSPISVVPKIGPKYQKLLEKLEIFKVEDLLYHFPFRYQDYTEFKNINELRDGDIVTVTAILGSVQIYIPEAVKELPKQR